MNDEDIVLPEEKKVSQRAPTTQNCNRKWVLTYCQNLARFTS